MTQGTTDTERNMTSTRLIDTARGRFRIALDGPADAPVLMFSNSLGTPLEMWERQAAIFSRTHRVLRYDTRGHGPDPVLPGPEDFDALGQDVIAILDALDIPRVRFCGLSMGGHTALWLGIHAGERLDALVVCNSAAKIGTESAWKTRADTIRAEGEKAMQALADTAPQRWFTADFIARQPKAVEAAQAWIRATSPEGYAGCCDALGQSDLRPLLGRISVPCLILAGAHDPVTTVDDAMALQAAVNGAQLVTVPASHLSNIETPDAFDAALSEFLGSLD